MATLECALISSGLGFTTRGIEVWMADLADHLPESFRVELWSGGPRRPTQRHPSRRIRALSRDAAVLTQTRRPWSKRYLIEQLTMLPGCLVALRRRGAAVAYLGDPVLAWHLKRFRRWHGAKVVFMNGMRLSPGWARDFDGVHLLADPYLDEARRELAGRDVSHFFAIPHFTDIARFHPSTHDERLEARTRWGLPTDGFVVLTLGPIGSVSGKRLDHLAREVAAAGSPALLLHAGGDEDGAAEVRSAVNQALDTRVRWLGRVNREDVASLLAATDVYSLGSLREPFSIAILEALAAGLPVVHHRETAMVWQTGQGGLAVSMEEAGAAAAAFRRLMNAPAERRSVGAAARSLAETRYAPEPVCAALTQALKGIAQRPGFQNSKQPHL